MKYKTSYFNKSIVLEDLKRLWGLGVLYFLCVFFTGPLQIMFRIGNPNLDPTYMVENFLNIRGSEIQLVFSIAFPIIVGMLIYRYIHTNKSTTVIHSLPITRKELYNSHNITGIFLVIVPIIINAIILVGLVGIYNDGSKLFQEIFTIQGIGIWMGKVVLINLVVYLISTLMAMISGVTLIQGILSFIAIFLPVGLGGLIFLNLAQLLYGFTINHNILDKLLMAIIPITIVTSNEKMTFGLVIWYILLSLILYIAAYYYYKNRHLERATDTIAFDILKPIFKYGVTFCAMVLGGAYFYSMNRVYTWLYIGYVIGAYLGYILAEMLIQKTIWVFKNMKGFLIYSIVIIIAFVGIKFDLIGFEKRIPETNKIENAYYGYGVYGYWNGDKKGLEEPDNIKAIKELHSEIIANKKRFMKSTNDENMTESRVVGIVYKLKNGKTIAREYDLPLEYIENNMYIKEIYESQEYKKNYYTIFNVDESTIDYIEINPSTPINRSVKIIGNDEIKEVVGKIKKDILLETYEEYNDTTQSWGNIMIRYETIEKEHELLYPRERRFHVSWKKNYDELSDWLKEKDYYEKARIMPDDIDYIVVEKIDESMKNDEVYKIADIDRFSKSSNKVEIRDKDKTADFLLNYEDRHRQVKDYLVGFYLKNGNSFLGWLDEDKVPQEILEQLK